MTSAPGTAVVVGASSGLGRAIATELARSGRALLLVASDLRDLDALASSLNLEHGIAVRALALDLARDPDPGARIAKALDGLPAIEALVLAAGSSRGDDDFSLDATAIGELVATNLHAPLAIAHALLARLVETRGVIVLIGSVAAVRGRRRNVVYAAAKRALVSFAESLRQRYAPDELRVQLYEPGFIATNLTLGMDLPTAPADPDAIARTIVRRLGRGSFRRYVPARWSLIALAMKRLPWSLYRRLRS